MSFTGDVRPVSRGRAGLVGVRSVDCTVRLRLWKDRASLTQEQPSVAEPKAVQAGGDDRYSRSRRTEYDRSSKRYANSGPSTAHRE